MTDSDAGQSHAAGRTDRLHLSPRHREKLEALLREHLPGIEVWAYGSRVNGESHDGSDLDLVLRAPDLQEVPVDPLADFTEALHDSTLPFLVEARDWARLPKRFHREIGREYVVIQNSASEDGEDSVSDWRDVLFGDCAELVRDSVPPSVMGNALYIGLEHIGTGTLTLTGQGLASDVTSTKKRFGRGDILFGKLRPYFRKVVRAPDDGICSTDIWVVRAKNGVSQDYLYYRMASQQFVDFATAGSEGTKMPRAVWEHVSRYNMSLPPLPEQQAIAHILSTLDDKIELNRRMNETLEAMARALFKSWFVDFEPVRAKIEGRWHPGESLPGLPAHLYDLFPDRLVESELGEVPDGWEVKSLGELVELAYGKALKAADRKGGAIPVYGSNGQVGWHHKRLVTGPGIVVGRKGNPGVVTWAHSDFFSIDTTFYVVPKHTDTKLPFLFFALTNQNLPSVSADSAVPGLNRNLAYMNMQIVPNQLILEEFNENAGATFKCRHHLEKESRNLTILRDTLLPKLVSGKLQPKRP